MKETTIGPATLYLGDCLETLRGMPDNSVDSICTDPPYGLSDHKPGEVVACLQAWLAGEVYAPKGKGFMGKSWDAWVPGPEVWRECLRVLKPGGHVLAFAGTRSMDLMSMALRLAGFELRDSIGYAHDGGGAPLLAWVYGCLSEDTEILTENGWMLYNRAKQERVLAYDVQADIYQWERPSRWSEYRVESDTAYRIQSDHTDQIVSRGHRCLVERGGMLAFVSANELAGVETVPTLRDNFFGVQEAVPEVLQQDLQRALPRARMEKVGAHRGGEGQRKAALKRESWRQEPGMERRCDLLQAQGEVCGSVDQVRSMPRSLHDNGSQGRVCNGAPAGSCNRDWQATDSDGVCSSHQPRCDRQSAGKPDAVCNQCGAQAVRARASYQTTLATVTAIEYSGLIWCPTVSTGAFVARRNGKVFITGNSGFPKSHDVSKAIDREAGAEREKKQIAYSTNVLAQGIGVDRPWMREAEKNGYHEVDGDTPATEAARKWQGWGSALKPALEPILLARKPLQGTIAQNVLAWGTGGLNVDGCRVGTESTRRKVNEGKGWTINTSSHVTAAGEYGSNSGRWPANLILQDSDDVRAGFPDTAPSKAALRGDVCDMRGGNYGNSQGSRQGTESVRCHTDNGGSAARFFYSAKVSKSERNEGMPDGMVNNHPTLKPVSLMAYLCRLITPPGGVVLDPFMGSGSTGKAAMREGFDFIGCELSPEYIAIASARIEHEWKKAQEKEAQPAQGSLM